MASCAACSSRVRLAARVAACLAPCVAARRPTLAARAQREVGMRSSRAIRSGGLHLAAGHDVVAPVGPADPRLVAAVVVVAEQDQRRRVAERGAGLGALGVEAAPDADERVVVVLLAYGRGVGVPWAQDGL